MGAKENALERTAMTELEFQRFGQLAEDASPVPLGMMPREGVEFGCGEATCDWCYEPLPPKP